MNGLWRIRQVVLNPRPDSSHPDPEMLKTNPQSEQVYYYYWNDVMILALLYQFYALNNWQFNFMQFKIWIFDYINTILLKWFI